MELSSRANAGNVIDAILAAVPEPFFIFDENGTYVQILGGMDRSKYHDGQHLTGKRIHDVMRKELADQFMLQIKKAIETKQVLSHVYQLSARDIKGAEGLDGPDGQQWFEAHISPIREVAGQPRMVVWIAFNITQFKNTLKEKDVLISELQKAGDEIKTLRGILPICCHCKKIRDDQGYWQQVESYVGEHSQAEFSHGICPDCVEKYYSQFHTEKNDNKRCASY